MECAYEDAPPGFHPSWSDFTMETLTHTHKKDFICKPCIQVHFYADDTQLYQSMNKLVKTNQLSSLGMFHRR